MKWTKLQKAPQTPSSFLSRSLPFFPQVSKCLENQVLLKLHLKLKLIGVLKDPVKGYHIIISFFWVCVHNTGMSISNMVSIRVGIYKVASLEKMLRNVSTRYQYRKHCTNTTWNILCLRYTQNLRIFHSGVIQFLFRQFYFWEDLFFIELW